VVRRNSSCGRRDEGKGRNRITRRGRIAGSRHDKPLAEKAPHAKTKFKLTPIRAAGSGVPSLRQRRHPHFIARIVFDVDICKGPPETVLATDSNCKSRDYRRARSGRILPPCGIRNPTIRWLPRCLLLRTKGHRQKLGSATFQTTSPLQEQRYQTSVSQGFSAQRALLGFPMSSKINSAMEKQIPSIIGRDPPRLIARETSPLGHRLGLASLMDGTVPPLPFQLTPLSSSRPK
jgi:hypothetical protein